MNCLVYGITEKEILKDFNIFGGKFILIPITVNILLMNCKVLF